MDGNGGTWVPCDVVDIAIEAARRAGEELLERFGRPPSARAGKTGALDLVSHAERVAARAIGTVLARRRPEDGMLGEEKAGDREGSTGLRWVVDPLDGTLNYLSGIPLWCVSIACEDAAGTIAGVVLDPVRTELFATVRGGGVRFDGIVPRRRAPRDLGEAVITGGVACATDPQATRAAKLEERLFRRAGQRRVLASAALELAWTAIGRVDVCFHEQWIHPWDVGAGLFLCRRAGLRVHRLPRSRTVSLPASSPLRTRSRPRC